LIASEDPIVVHVTVPIRQLPESLDGFRIIQLSDLHVGVSVGRTRVERVVKIVNELCSQTKDNNKCDLVALTGDIIDGEPYQLIKGIEPLKKLVTDIPKLFVTGNHEHIHQNVDHSLEVLSEMGIDCIVNDNIRLPKGKSGQKLVIVGLTDFSVGKNRGWEQRAFEGTKPNQDTIILLAHQPNHLRVARQYGVDLMLSGHTHAGQFFPGTIGAWLFNSKYSGYYPSKETAVYVSAGTHWWGPPVRFTTRHHEITDITLIKMRE
jgi:predicted MPP superfamily phosphohydrolase